MINLKFIRYSERVTRYSERVTRVCVHWLPWWRVYSKSCHKFFRSCSENTVTHYLNLKYIYRNPTRLGMFRLCIGSCRLVDTWIVLNYSVVLFCFCIAFDGDPNEIAAQRTRLSMYWTSDGWLSASWVGCMYEHVCNCIMSWIAFAFLFLPFSAFHSLRSCIDFLSFSGWVLLLSVVII